jgi:uncharacterized protein YbjT (DUF2867 family)
MEPEAVTTVFVAGATGGTGREVVRLLAPRVRTVRALTRSKGRTEALHDAGADEVVVDDLLAPTDLDAALTDVDVVISAVGSTLRDVASGGPFVDGAGTRALVDAAAAAGVEAFAMESAIGVGDAPASALATAFDAFIGPLQRAKARGEAAVRDAPFDHVVFRPGVLTDGPRTDLATVGDPGAKLWGAVSRRDVARLLVAAPTTPAATNRTFEVVSNPCLRDRGVAVDWRLPGRR